MKRRYLLLLSVIPVVLALVFLIPLIKADAPSPRSTTPSELAELVETLKIWKLVDAVSPNSGANGAFVDPIQQVGKIKNAVSAGTSAEYEPVATVKNYRAWFSSRAR